MNFPFHDEISFMAEAEPGSAIMFPATGTTQFPSSNSPMEAMREMMFRVAAMQPVRVDPDSVKPRKRRNVRISSDPQSVAARHRRERISERIRILQRMVPGGTKMDTASMLEEAVRYLKFLKREVKSLEEMTWRGPGVGAGGLATGNCVGSSWGMRGPYSIMHSHVVGEI